MKYCVAIEYTQRKEIWFEAENEKDAMVKGRQLYEQVESDDNFQDEEWDYCIRDEGDLVIEPWD